MIRLRTFIVCERQHQLEIPDKFKEDDNRSFEEVVEYFIRKFTEPGDTVLDIFAGLGTTLIISEKLKRVPYGLEYLEDRYNYVISKIQHKENLILGDARKLLEYKFPPIDLVYTSPIFMNKNENRDPLNGYKSEGNYNKFLKGLQSIFTDLKLFLKLNSKIIIEVANLKGDGITTLAWDLGKILSEILYFDGEVIICWEGSRDSESAGYDHSYCLIFTNKH
ncbi:MAG: DNA methyltransferase [Candidatus Thorarchaeota archaeon]